MLSRSIALALIPLCLFAACAEERTTVDATSAEDAEIAPDRLDAAASPDQGVAKADTGVSVGDDAEVDAGIAAPVLMAGSPRSTAVSPRTPAPPRSTPARRTAALRRSTLKIPSRRCPTSPRVWSTPPPISTSSSSTAR